MMSKLSKKCAASLTGAVGIMAMVAAMSAPTAMAEPKKDPAAEVLASAEGISVAEARKVLDRDEKLSNKALDLGKALGQDDSAGSWIDSDGTLHVAVVNDAAAAKVTKSGAKAVKVKNSLDELNAITDKLNKAAKAGQVDDLNSWSVDVKTNQIVIMVNGDITEKASKSITKANDAIRVEKTEATPMTTKAVVGGSQFEMQVGVQSYVCSAGFGAKDSAGKQVMVTAGHCMDGVSKFTYGTSTAFADARGFSFPTNDYGALNLRTGYEASGLVKSSGGNIAVKNSNVAAVGAAMCKSGRTTAWTCGKITGTNATVNYQGGDVVYGLVKHNACVQGGDSGGSNLSGSSAQGVTSGGQLYETSPDVFVCGEKVGQPNVGYYQPLNEALSAYNLTLVTG